MSGCKCVSVTAIISNSSMKLLRTSNLFRALRIFMLHIEMELSLTLERFSNSGPGLTSTLPMIRIYCNTNKRKTMSILGFMLLSKESETTRNVHRKLILYNSFYRNRPPSNLQLEHHVHTHHHIIEHII